MRYNNHLKYLKIKDISNNQTYNIVRYKYTVKKNQNI